MLGGACITVGTSVVAVVSRLSTRIDWAFAQTIILLLSTIRSQHPQGARTASAYIGIETIPL